MPDFLSYIQEAPYETKRLTRGYNVDESTLSIGFEQEPTPYDFGLSPKDSIEFSIYSSDGIKLAWKIVDDEPNFEVVNLDYTNMDGERVGGQARVFTKNYPTIDGNVVVSPSSDAKSLGIESGYYYMRYSFVNDIVGSNANKTKLLIKDISNSRTEIKIIPECLKTSKRTEDISLSFDYENFVNKKLPVSHLYNFTPNLLKDTVIFSAEFEQSLLEIISNYDDAMSQAMEVFGTTEKKQVLIEVDEVRKRVFELYKNTLLSEYNEVYTRTDFYVQYINTINYEISNQRRLADSEVPTDVIDLFKTILITLFDSDYLNQLFIDRFEMYFNNYINFGTSESYPILSTTLTNENVGDDEKHTPLIIKLAEPLPQSKNIGDKLYISNKLYSDDVVQKVTYYQEIKSNLNKLRGPNRSQVVKNSGTKEYTKDELNEESSTTNVDDITLSLSSYFNNNINRGTKKFDNFSDFVKFSSAKSQLDIFIQKFSKISKLINTIGAYEYSIAVIDKKIEDNRLPDTEESRSSITILQRIDLKEKLSELEKELLMLSDYERFLFYENSIRAYPRSRDILVSKITGSNRLANGKYLKYGIFNEKTSYKHWLGDWYLWWDSQTYEWVLSDNAYSREGKYVSFKSESYFFEDQVKWHTSSGFNGEDTFKIGEEVIEYGPEKGRTAPEFISEDVNAWSTTSLGYKWYVDMATEAAYYDKSNDDYLGLNIPEFLIRNEENEDFIKLLNVVGLTFDTIDSYIENMGNSRAVTNSAEKGISDELVYYFLNAYGMNFTGKDTRTDSASKVKITDKNSAEYRRSQIWRRILNNMPYILKTKGTKEAVEALIRCYDIPEQLFATREYGGASNEDSLTNFSEFSFDTFDYRLSITNEDEYLQVPWHYNGHKPKSVEFKVFINDFEDEFFADTQQVDWAYAKNFTPIVLNNTWAFGLIRAADYPKGWGHFYFTSSVNDNNYESTIPPQSDSPIYFEHEDGYDVLIQVVDRYKGLKRKMLSILVKRQSDGEIVYDESSDILIDEHSYLSFSHSADLYIGNYVAGSFRGEIDRLRIYSEPIDENDFLQHIKFGQSYSLKNSNLKVEDNLLFKANFDSPHDISYESNYQLGYGIIPNSSLKESHAEDLKCFNFKNTEYPYDFVGGYKKEYAELPSFGAQVFNNKKIRVEKQETTSNLNPYSRVTKKSLDRIGVDTNKLGVFFGKSVSLNEEILKFFGKIKLGDYIGNPEDYGKKEYKDLKILRNLFFKQGFGKVDWFNYINQLKGYFDESFFDNLEKLVPGRSILTSGLLIEPLLLERPKTKGVELGTDLESNVDRIQIIEPTEKIKPLKNIRLSAKNKNKDIIDFANSPVYGNRKTDQNVTCMTSNFLYKKINGLSYKSDMFENVNYDYLHGICSNFGHTSFDGKTYRVELEEFKLSHQNRFTSGLVDYTIANKVKLTLETRKTSTSVDTHFSSSSGEYISDKNLNGERLFINYPKTWFIYFEPYNDRWILINTDPRLNPNTNELLSDGRYRRMYSTTTGTQFPTEFRVNAYTEVTTILGGNHEGWDEMFKIYGTSGWLPLNRNRNYLTTSTVYISNDKYINISGEVLGVVDCELEGSFTGSYNEITKDGSLIVNKHGSYIFRGLKKNVKLDGTFTGTLARGFIGSEETKSEFIVKNGFVNAERFGGCYFSNKKMYGFVNDIVEDDLRYTKLDLKIFDSNKINVTDRTFKNIKLVPVPTKVKYDVVDESVKVKKRVLIERNSTNDVFYDGAIRTRKTVGTYENCFYHRTTDEIVPSILHDIKLNLKAKLKTNQIRGIKIVAYSENMASVRTQQNYSYKRKFKTQAIKNETYSINLGFDFFYEMETDTYRVEAEIFSRGRDLNANSYYKLHYDEYGDSVSEKLNFYDGDVWDNLDDIYDADLIFVIEKEEVKNEFRNTRSALFSLDIDAEKRIYFVANLNDEVMCDTNFHSLDYVENVKQKIEHGDVQKLNTNELYDQAGIQYTEKLAGVSYDKIEIKHNRHKKIHNNLKVGDSIRLSIYGKQKVKYSLQVNRELTPDEEDDSEAIIFTKDTLDCHVVYDINEKFLRYRSSIESLKYHSYYTAESPSNYFLILPKSEYLGFNLDGFSGRWKSANGLYKTSYRINGKYSYVNENDDWIVFWTNTTPRCNKENLQGAWVLVKNPSESFPSLLQENLTNLDIDLWMYGFIPSQYNSEVSYENSIHINVTHFSTDYGTGKVDSDLTYQSKVSYIRELCNDRRYVSNQLKERSDISIDTSFVLIPNKPAFEFAEKFGRNTLGVKDQILSWALNIKSVESKLPARGLYDKVKPIPDADVQLEIDYIQSFDKTKPIVRVVGADVRTTEFRMTEGEYYETTLESNGYPVYRNQNGFLIRRDKYLNENSEMEFVWVVSQDKQPINTKTQNLLNKQRLVFVSRAGSCTSDDFNFRVGYDMNPNMDTSRDRNDMLADSFKDGVLLKGSETSVEWGYNRNENACSVCEDITTPDYKIQVLPDDIYTSYSGKKEFITIYQGKVEAKIEFNQLNVSKSVTRFQGNYSKSDGSFCNSLMCYEQIDGTASLKKNTSGWILEAFLDVSNLENELSMSTNVSSYISSNNTEVSSLGTIYQHPKYGMYISSEGNYSFIYYEKDEYSNIKICVNSDDENLHPKFLKTTYIKNGRPVYENENSWFIFYNKEEISEKEYWCISDSMSDRNIKYKADVRWQDERNQNEGDRHYDEEFGVYYLKQDGIDFNEANAIVVNMDINFNDDNVNNIINLDKIDTSSISYRLNYENVRTLEDNIIEILPVMSEVKNRYITELPISVNYKPEIFYRDFPKLININLENSGDYGYSDSNKQNTKLSITSLENTDTHSFDLNLENTYSRIKSNTKKSFKSIFKTNPSNVEKASGILEIGEAFKKYYINEIEYDIDVDIKSIREPIVLIDNLFKVNQKADFNEFFVDDSNEVEREIIIEFDENLSYSFEKNYSLTDVNKVKINNKLVKRGRSKEHLSYKRRNKKRVCKNSVYSTVSMETGETNLTSPIIRTRKVSPRVGYDSGSPDSFWFIDDIPITETPKQKPVIVRKGIYDLPQSELNNLEFYFSFNDSDSIYVRDLDTPTPSPSPSPTATETPSETPIND